MGIINTDSCSRASAHKKFFDGIRSNKFHILVYTFMSPGRATNWVVVFKITFGSTLENPKVVEYITIAAKSAPRFLSQRLTKDTIAMICNVTECSSKRLAQSFLDAILPNNVQTNLAGCNDAEVQQVMELTSLIQSGDFVNDDED
eukprot:6212946-Ditylum_brightwellii.AAC.1